MSVHRSLKAKTTLKRRRNVLTRTERVEALQRDEKWPDGRSVFGLPSMRVERTKRRREPAAAAPPTEQPAEGEQPQQAPEGGTPQEPAAK